MRIVYIIDSLAFKGGAERVISEKMNYLATKYDYDVSIITCYQLPETMLNTYPLSSKVKQINLCIPLHLQYKYSYPKRLWIKWKLFRQLCQRLEETINTIQPVIIIGVGYTLADVVCHIKYKAPIIIESHEARLYTLKSYLYRDYSPLSIIYLKLYRKKYLHLIEKKADVVVTLTKDDVLNWRKAKRVETIPNFSIMPISKLSDCESKRVIAVGRLGWQKGYDRLLDIWQIVSIKHPDWQLDIFGEGPLEEDINNHIKQSKINNIIIHPFNHNISQEYANSSICVLTSRYEGFSLVLLEAMRHGVPCISFDCPYGPKDLIDHEECGYIIEDGNIEQFAENLHYLMEHIDIRKQFGNAAIIKAQNYNVDSIMNQWKMLFSSLLSEYNS